MKQIIVWNSQQEVESDLISDTYGVRKISAYVVKETNIERISLLMEELSAQNVEKDIHMAKTEFIIVTPRTAPIKKKYNTSGDLIPA